MGDTGSIVVGVDGSNHTVAAARWAAAVAARSGDTLHLVHVMSSVDQALMTIITPEREDAGSAPRELGHEVLDRTADAVRADFPELSIVRTLSQRPIEDLLTELSRQARLVVLACADVSPLGALVVGSTTVTVARHSHCPVVAWRGDASAPNPAPIVVGIDETREPHACLMTALGLADQLGVPLIVVHALSPRRAPGDINIPILVDYEELEHEALQRLSSAVAPVAGHWPRVDVRCAVGTGNASRVILDHADGAQFVVVGNRGRGSLASAILGSTGLSLLHHSSVPVIVCPTPAASDEAHSVQGVSPNTTAARQ
ncbi:universal stress protein [Mycolicibacterium komossense]|uniref:Universal stress protein n=1 Tax=Mycolicibacterium komossense TaxID=1779 RepID=A0ABT3CK26_9MYCO|nr:universal stress protein [Mycolicibacterium komossense]MCV7229591.1 universal stress protein [Mycolicibacterium komossense]